MGSALDDLLLRGLTGRTPWKAEAVACATTNVTLSGEQTIDDIECVSGDGVHLTGQTDLAENGTWVASTGAWVRRADFSDIATARIGTTVLVARGTANSGVWRMASPITGYVTPGITDTEWIKVSSFAAGAAYTAGPGISINPTGNAITVDLTDTDAFTSTGTPNRAALVDGSGYITASGILANVFSGASAATMSIGTANQTALNIGRGATVTTIFGSTVEITGALTNNGSPISGGSVTESAVRSAAAGFTATLDVNGQTVSNCAGVTSTGTLALTGGVGDDATLSAGSTVSVYGGTTQIGVNAACNNIPIGRPGLTSCAIDGGTTLTCTGATVQINAATLLDINAGALDFDGTGATAWDCTTYTLTTLGAVMMDGDYPFTRKAGNSTGGQQGLAEEIFEANALGTSVSWKYNSTTGLNWVIDPAGDSYLNCANAANYAIRHNGTPRLKVNSTGMGFFNTAPVAKPAALTAANGSALNTGDATSDTVIANMRTRIGELETKLQALGLLS